MPDSHLHIEVLVATAQPAVTTSLCRLLELERDLVVVDAVDDLAGAVRALLRLTAGALVLDVALLGYAGMPRLGMLRSAAPGVAIVAVGMHEQRGYRSAALRAGAAGYVELDRADRDLPATIRRVADHRRPETEQDASDGGRSSAPARR